MDRRDYAPGEVIPGTIYRVLRKIGAGGMGAVYEVEDTTVGKRYVLKAMHPDLCERKDLTRRMQIEARTLGRLAHPNIVEVVTAGATADDPPRPYFVMERLEGRSLRAVLDKKGRLGLQHAYGITLDLLAALAHAHRHDVVHRDVKPDNLFLHRAHGETITKLLDFGIMRIARDGHAHGDTAGRFVGTLRYAAPEQLRGDRTTPQTDLYAVGLVIFEMVAGRGPFDDEGDAQAVASAHLKNPAPPLSSFRRVPAALDALVASALAKDPALRPRSAEAFAEALRAIAEANEPDVDAPLPRAIGSSAPPRVASESEIVGRRRRMLLALIAVVAATAAVAALAAGAPRARRSSGGAPASGSAGAASTPGR